MNEKEAMEIIRKFEEPVKKGHANILDVHKIGKTLGYLEAIGKANNRIEKINNAWKEMRRFLYGAQFDLLKASMAQGKIEKVQDEINQWEKEK